MRVRSFVLWAALGVSLSTAGALLVPAPSARAGAWPNQGIDPDPDPAAPQAHFVDGKTLLLDGRLGHASVARDASGRNAGTFVLATITGGDAPAGERFGPPPVHLAIVVDRSGSMAGPKMNNAIAAAIGVVDRMHDGDRATVVAFDTTARVVVPPTTIDAGTRPSVEAAVRAVRSGGDTCISCALETATAALDSAPGSRDEIRRILLISDGEATTGVRDVGGLRTLAGRARDRGLSVSTIGVDLAFDERVMAAIAQESNGRHWFVPDASALTQVFEQELGTLETAVATEAELSIEPAAGVVVDDILDRSFRREGGRIVVPLGAFDARQEKTVLMRARVPADLEGVQQVVRLSLGYRDVLRRSDGRCDGALALEVRGDGSAQRELDPFVAARVERSRTSRALTDANDLFERGRVDEAKAALTRRQNELATAEKPALAAGRAMPIPAKAAARPLDSDFGEQQSALSQAQAGFANAPAAGATASAQPSTPAGKSAVRQNQANASDLAF